MKVNKFYENTSDLREKIRKLIYNLWSPNNEITNIDIDFWTNESRIYISFSKEHKLDNLSYEYLKPILEDRKSVV